MRYTPVSQTVTRRWRATRTAVVLTATALFFGVSIRPAAAADNGGIDRCTTTRAAEGLMTLIWQNIINPIRDYGWFLFAVVLVIAVITSAIGSRDNKWWGTVGWVLVLMLVVVGALTGSGVLNPANSGSSGC